MTKLIGRIVGYDRTKNLVVIALQFVPPMLPIGQDVVIDDEQNKN